MYVNIGPSNPDLNYTGLQIHEDTGELYIVLEPKILSG